jgi:spoIIIJ-associated protein
MEKVKETLENILNKAEINFSDIEVAESDTEVVFCIKTNQPDLLIENKGEILGAIDLLVKKICSINKHTCQKKVFIDVNNFKEKRKEEVIKEARILSDRATNLKTDIKMSPMNSYERMLVHDFLSEKQGVFTESIGEGDSRAVVIKCKQD